MRELLHISCTAHTNMYRSVVTRWYLFAFMQACDVNGNYCHHHQSYEKKRDRKVKNKKKNSKYNLFKDTCFHFISFKSVEVGNTHAAQSACWRALAKRSSNWIHCTLTLALPLLMIFGWSLIMSITNKNDRKTCSTRIKDPFAFFLVGMKTKIPYINFYMIIFWLM